jgi:hypothetical protein
MSVGGRFRCDVSGRLSVCATIIGVLAVPA